MVCTFSYACARIFLSPGARRGVTSLNCNRSVLLRFFGDDSKMGRPRVFFDMKADGRDIGRITFEVSVKNTFFSNVKT